MFAQLLKCISPQGLADQARMPWGQLATTQLHELLTGLFPVMSFAGPTALPVLFWIYLPAARRESSRVRFLPWHPPRALKGCSKSTSAALRGSDSPGRGAAGAGLQLSAFPRKVRAPGTSRGHSCSVIRDVEPCPCQGWAKYAGWHLSPVIPVRVREN